MTKNIIYKNAISYLQKKLPKAMVSHLIYTCNDQNCNLAFTYCSAIGLDFESGIKQRLIAIEDFGSKNEINFIAAQVENSFAYINGVYIKAGNRLTPSGHDIDTKQMSWSPRVYIYTNKLSVPIDDILYIFDKQNIPVQIIDESKIHKTLFISYGGKNTVQAKAINEAIKSHGITTWFFEDDAEPGQKLHRMMYEGVNTYDKVLLICSESSLNRNGVLNEIERCLEREARESGNGILIPVALDDFIYDDWRPTNPDIAGQIRSRVITKIDPQSPDFLSQIDKIVRALK